MAQILERIARPGLLHMIEDLAPTLIIGIRAMALTVS
jgi:hypothetical protein